VSGKVSKIVSWFPPLSVGHHSTLLVIPDNFDDYWRVASKIAPTTAPTRSSSPQPVSLNPSMHTRPPSVDPQTVPDRDGAYNVRSVPVRLYLPDGPVMQDVVPPTLEDGASPFKPLVMWTVGTDVYSTGSAHTLAHYLSTLLPLLFPPLPYPGSELAYALIQGVLVPPDAEMAWLGACMAGADGWVSVCVGIAR
jgi:autophagy-related protein 5